MFNWFSQLSTLYPKHSIAIVIILLVTAASLLLHGTIVFGLAIAALGSLVSAVVAANHNKNNMATASAITFVVALTALYLI